MIRGFAASLLVVVFAVDAGVLRHRIADELSALPYPGAYEQIKEMKLTEVAKRLASSPYVRHSVQRAAMDLQANAGLREMIPRITMNSKVQQVLQKLAKEDLAVKDLANLRQRTSPEFQASVRSALDSLMADEGSKSLATHLKQAWDAKDADEQMKHLNMALDVLDTAATTADEEVEDEEASKVEEAAAEDGADELVEEADPGSEDLNEEVEEEVLDEDQAADEEEEEADEAEDEEADEAEEEEEADKAEDLEEEDEEADEAEDLEEEDEEADEAEDQEEIEAAEEEKNMADPSA